MDYEIKKMLIENNKLLEKLVKNTSPKEEHQIIVSDNKSVSSSEFESPLLLDKDKQYEIALVDLETYYSFPNISKYNNVIEYTINNKTKKIIIPVGSYEFNGLNKEIQRQLKSNGDEEAFELIANLNTFKSILDIKPDYTVDFSHNRSIKKVLGFTQDIYKSGINESENIVNILAINSIFVHINVINGSIVNGSEKPVIYSFFPKVSPGYKIIQKPVNPIYLPVTLNAISNFNVSITDQNEKPLDLRGEEITIRFHLRER